MIDPSLSFRLNKGPYVSPLSKPFRLDTFDFGYLRVQRTRKLDEPDRGNRLQKRWRSLRDRIRLSRVGKRHVVLHTGHGR
jgi:hypothetical protein